MQPLDMLFIGSFSFLSNHVRLRVVFSLFWLILCKPCKKRDQNIASIWCMLSLWCLLFLKSVLNTTRHMFLCTSVQKEVLVCQLDSRDVLQAFLHMSSGRFACSIAFKPKLRLMFKQLVVHFYKPAHSSSSKVPPGCVVSLSGSKQSWK